MTQIVKGITDTQVWGYIFKAFFLSMAVTVLVIGALLQIPATRRRIFSAMDRLAEWHERGTREQDDVDDDRPQLAEVKGEDPFRLAKIGQKIG